jgi:hypothetical protein
LRELNIEKMNWSQTLKQNVLKNIEKNKNKGAEFLNYSIQLGVKARNMRRSQKITKKLKNKQHKLENSNGNINKENYKNHKPRTSSKFKKEKKKSYFDEYEAEYRKERRFNFYNTKNKILQIPNQKETKNFLDYVEQSDSIINNSFGEKVMNLKLRNVDGNMFKNTSELVLDSIHKKLNFMTKMLKK